MKTAEALTVVPGAVGDASPSGLFITVPTPELPLPKTEELVQPIDAEQAAASSTLAPIADPSQRPPPDQQGELAQHSPIRLFFQLALEEESGLLVFQKQDLVKEVYLEDGDPEYVSSNQPHELFGQYLMRKGVVTEEQLNRALALLPRFNGKLGAALVSLKLLRPMEVLRHLTRQVRQKLLQIFGWPDGTFSFYRDRMVQADAAPLGLDGFEIVSAGVEKVPWERVQRRLEPLRQRRLVAVRPAPVPPEVFRLGDRGRDLLAKLDGRRSLEDLLLSYDDEDQRQSFARLVFLFVETELVSIGS
jgi:serine/threonine-protein kinase